MKYFLLLLITVSGSIAFAQNVNIPDANMKAALVADTEINTNADSEISVAEAEAFTGTVNLSYKSIADHTGLEAFTNITRLLIGGNASLTSLDVSANTSLTYLNTGVLPITSIDLSANTSIDTLVMLRNELSTLDISDLTNLIYLDVRDNNLTSIDVTINTALKQLYIDQNDITTFTFPESLKTDLIGLGYGDNPLANAFDFTQFPNLTRLYVGSSDLTSLDVSSLTQLEWLICNNNPITTLDVSQNTALTSLVVGGTSITDLDLSQNPNLSNVNFSTPISYLPSKIQTINLANGNNDKIEYFYLSNNSDLSCIKVDDSSNPFPNLLNSNFDGFSNFAEECISGSIVFVDPVFKQALLDHDPVIDTNDDGYITEDEAAALTGTLSLRQKAVKNVSGIEFFTNITGLDLYATEVRNLDLSGNTSLNDLDLSYITELTILSLDNGNNEAISSITWAGSYPLKCITVDDPTYSETNWTGIPSGVGFSTDCEVTVSSQFKTALINDGYDLNADGEIQVSEAEAVTGELNYYASYISYVGGLEAFVNVSSLNFGDASPTLGLNSIDVTQNAQLITLKLASSKISSLDLSCNSRLKELDLTSVTNTNFKTLDLSNNQSLVTLRTPGAPFEDIDLSQCKQIQTLYVNNNNLTSLDLRNHSQLKYFRADNNELTYLNLKNGNNDLIYGPGFNISNNPDLSCVTVDDVTYAEANFTNKDATTSYDPDCDNFIIDFPDTNLESALLTYDPVIDLNSDGDIRLDEAEAFTGVLDVSSLGIADATGLIYFSNLTGLDISDNSLTDLDIKNGNNENFTLFDATGNVDLTCIKVDNPIYSEANWSNVEAGVTFSAYCDPDEIIYIPDADLKKVLLDYLHVDTSGDDEVSYSEALTFTGNLDLDQLNIHIADVTGIEAFENITGFESGNGNTISELDLTGFSELTSVRVVQNIDGPLGSLDLSQNLLLETISISRVAVPDLDLTLYPNLVDLGCNTCELSSVDLSQNTELTHLSLSYNPLTAIDLSNNTQLVSLSLYEDPITAIDLSMLTGLTDLYLAGEYTSMDVSTLVNLVNLELVNVQFTEMDLSNNILLEDVRVYAEEDEESGMLIRSALEVLTFGENSLIEYMELDGNSLRSIDLTFMANDKYRYVSLYDNLLEEINVGLIQSLTLDQNPNLTCAQTTDVAYATANYSYDEGLTFDENCYKTGTDILTFSFTEEVAAASVDAETHQIVIEVVAGTDISSLSPSITLSSEASVSPNSGVLQDFTSTVVYTVTAEDGGTQDWEVFVIEQLADPTDIELSSTSIDENGSINDVVGTLSAVDPSFDNTHTYELVSGEGDTDNASFTISGEELLALEVFDFETKSSYSIRVNVNDGESGVFAKQLSITISDVNDAPTDIALSANTIDEGAELSTLIGSFSVTDEDAEDTFTYALVEGELDNSSFTISDGELLSNEVFDYETKTAYNIRVSVTDQGGASFEETFDVFVNDVSSIVSTFALSVSEIEENEAVGTAVGAFTTEGTDLSGTFSYSLIEGDGDTDNASFNIDGTQLLSAEIFNFESKSNYTIRVLTDDGNENTLERIFTLTIVDIAETPTAIALSNSSITENNKIGAVIGALSTTDEDADDTHTYALIEGDGSTDNSMFEIDGASLIANTLFDFESKNTFEIRLSTTDATNNQFEQNFTITISNENEGVSIANAIEDVSREEGFSSYEIDLSNVFEDEDGDELSFTVVSSDLNVVEVSLNDAGTSILITEIGLGTSEITVTASDPSGDFSVDQSFSFEVTEIPNTDPVVAVSLSDQSQEEGFGMLQVDLSGVFTDADGDELTLSATSTNDQVVTVSIESGNQLVLTEVATGTAEVTVTADDGNGGLVSDAFAFSIVEQGNIVPEIVNPIADQTQEEGFGIMEISFAGVFEDEDGDPLTISASSGDVNVVSVEILEGDILQLTEVGVGTSTISLTAIDGKGGAVTDEFIFSVSKAGNSSPVVEAPIADQVQDEGFGFVEISYAGVFSDADNDALTVQVSSSETSVATVELIAGDLIKITEIGTGSAIITLTATDGNGGTVSDEFTLTIVPNSAPTVVSALDNLTIEEGFAEEEIDISGVFADADGEELSYSVSSSDQSVATVSLEGSMLTISEVGLGVTQIELVATDPRGASTAVSFEVTIEAAEVVTPLGSISTEVKIYPNPVVSYVIVSGTEDTHLQLIDIKGTILKESKGVSHRLDMQELQKGIYFIKLYNGKTIVRKKIIKIN